MKEIPTAPPLPNAPPTQDFSKLGFVCITILGLANQVVPHTGSWCLLATALNYLVWIAPIVYMAFQARLASPMGAQSDSDMGRDTMLHHIVPAKPLVVKPKEFPLIFINFDCPVLPEALQEIIECYFQEHSAFLAAVCTTEKKQDPAEAATFAANKSASGYFLFYGSINNGQTIYQPAILLDTGASENFMSVETAVLLQLKYHLGMLVRGETVKHFPLSSLRSQ
ncbi:hypothetical protein DSO57_1006222 [Entomophthora muscae]|uniref:Uncharacterized protein n=1 Tax=Entomophthora muscae TaxID=34485 RepID=A0ACC2SAF4_9FUNG|nr:hypothetical protein DSO57_1006222 [Entomophthora muscae]